MKTYARLFSLIALSLFLTSPAIAQEQKLNGSKPLTGQVEFQVAPTRIKRTPMQPVQAPYMTQQQQPLNSSVSAGAFSQSPLQTQEPVYAPIYRAPIKARTGQTQLKAQANQNGGRAPYIWVPSRDGGYYDASGNTKQVVPANQLHKWGGSFNDGTAVPNTPIQSSNFAQHAYKQGGLQSQQFWRKGLFSPF